MTWLAFQQLDPPWIHQFLFCRDIFLCGHGPNCRQSTKNSNPLFTQAWVDGVLRWRANDDIEGTYHPMHHKQNFDRKNTLVECKIWELCMRKQLWIA